ncbi:MAG: integrase core domain-containing protein [Alphaproteobacteria bacterium]|nr:integrase core domain-containing protein [Alphaproteobacteria bacterium]
MQREYFFNGIKGYSTFKRFSYLFDMDNKEANDRYKIIQFYDKYGLEATIEAFNISRRTIYRWKSKLKENGITSLKPKSTKPKQLRTPTTPKLIVNEIKRLREKYPNIGKAKLYILLAPFCKENNLSLPSESTIGRIISRDKDKMRLFPHRIDRNGKIKSRKKEIKNRKPKGLKTEPMQLWAVDTIQRVSNGIRRYILTMIDPNTRIAFAVAIPTKHTSNTAKVLEALIDGLTQVQSEKKEKFLILSDNGSEFKKDFQTLVKEKELTHYFTYPKSPKMNAHNERFNRTIQEQFVDYNNDLLFTNIDLFNEKMADWLIDYNTKIPHHSLQMNSPVQYLLNINPQCHMYWTYTLD